jgi:subtilisin family serine protease
MSLGGGLSTALDAAVQKAVADGIVYCVAAGNSKVDASSSSPARVAEAITVAASDLNDNLASYSNFGPIVDIIAPGTAIKSDWITSSTSTNTLSGTSMATPHVAGAAALYLARNPGTSPANVETALKNLATLNRIKNVPDGTTNALLYIGF